MIIANLSDRSHGSGRALHEIMEGAINPDPPPTPGSHKRSPRLRRPSRNGSPSIPTGTQREAGQDRTFEGSDKEGGLDGRRVLEVSMK